MSEANFVYNSLAGVLVCATAAIDLVQIWHPMPDCHTCLLFSGFSNVYIPRVWLTALKLGCITNFDMLFLVMGFVSLVDEMQFMLISNRHICIRFIRLSIL